MKIVIRTDSSKTIGTGHTMRCLTLADELKEHGAEIIFICRDHEGNINDLITEKSYKLINLSRPPEIPPSKLNWTRHAVWLGVPWEKDAEETRKAIYSFSNDIDLLIIDHYALDYSWGGKLRDFVKKIMVIDDLADRIHACDFLLDQNFYLNIENRYEGLISKACKKLLGPRYTLLRPEFRIARKHMKVRDGCIKHFLVFMGGSDPDNATGNVLESFKILNRDDITVDIVLGPHSMHLNEILQNTNNMSYVNVHENVKNMSTLMNYADFMIGGGGTNTWERCCLGLPTLIISIAENQIEIAKAVDTYGAASYLGSNKNVDAEKIAEILHEMLVAPMKVKSMSNKAKELVDGLGAQRILKELMN